MKIGGPNAQQISVDISNLASAMPDRIRDAHQSAKTASAETTARPGVEPATSEPVEPQGVGAELRAALETIVSDVVSPARRGPEDLVGAVLEVVISDRLERSDLPGPADMEQAVAEQMRRDPTVVFEIDDILQSIARQLALRGA